VDAQGGWARIQIGSSVEIQALYTTDGAR